MSRIKKYSYTSMLTKQKPLPPVSASEITCDDGEKK